MTDEQDEVIDVPLIIPKRKKESDIPLLIPKKKAETEQDLPTGSKTTVSQSKNGWQLDPAFSPSTALLGRGTQESSLQGLGLPVMNENVPKTGATPEKRVTVNTPFGQSSIPADAPITKLGIEINKQVKSDGGDGYFDSFKVKQPQVEGSLVGDFSGSTAVKVQGKSGITGRINAQKNPEMGMLGDQGRIGATDKEVSTERERIASQVYNEPSLRDIVKVEKNGDRLIDPSKLNGWFEKYQKENGLEYLDANDKVYIRNKLYQSVADEKTQEKVLADLKKSYSVEGKIDPITATNFINELMPDIERQVSEKIVGELQGFADGLNAKVQSGEITAEQASKQYDDYYALQSGTMYPKLMKERGDKLAEHYGLNEEAKKEFSKRYAEQAAKRALDENMGAYEFWSNMGWKDGAAAGLHKGMGDVVKLAGDAMMMAGWEDLGQQISQTAKSQNLPDVQLPELSPENLENLADPVWWNTVIIPTLPLMAETVAPSLITGGATSGFLTGLGIKGATKLLMSGTAAGITNRGIESILEGAGQYGNDIEKGLSPEIAAQHAADVTRKNMNLVGLDAMQYAMLFAKIPAPVKLLFESGTGFGEEMVQGFYQVQQENPNLPFLKYAGTPEAFETGTAGGIMGAMFAGVGVLGTQKQGSKYQKASVVYDMLSSSEKDTQKRGEQMIATLDELSKTGMIDEKSYNDAKTITEAVITEKQNLPEDLTEKSKKEAVLYNIQVAELEQQKAKAPQAMEKIYQEKIDAIPQPTYILDDKDKSEPIDLPVESQVVPEAEPQTLPMEGTDTGSGVVEHASQPLEESEVTTKESVKEEVEPPSVKKTEESIQKEEVVTPLKEVESTEKAKDKPKSSTNEKERKEEGLLSPKEKKEEVIHQVKSNKDVSRVFTRLLKDEHETDDYGIHGLLADFGGEYNPDTERITWDDTRSGEGKFTLSKKEFINDILSGKLEKQIPEAQDFIQKVKESILDELGIKATKEEVISSPKTENVVSLEDGKELNNDRLSSDEKRGGIEAGETFIKASNIIEGVYRTGQDVSRSIEDIRHEEESLLEKQAKENRTWVDNPTEVYGDTPHMLGAEQNVYLNKDGVTLTKINSGSMHETWQEFLDRIALHNQFDPSTKYTLKGFTRHEGDFSAIIEQQHVKGKPAIFDEVKADLKKKGFELIPEEENGGGATQYDFRNKKTGVLLFDVHGKNVIKDEVGNLRYIDPILFLDTPQKGFGGTRKTISSPKTKTNGKEKSTDSTSEKTKEVEKGGDTKAPTTEKTFTEKAKKIAEKIRSFKSKPLELKDEKGNPIIIAKKGIDQNDIIEGIAKLVEAGGQLADAIATELSKHKWYNDLTDKGKEGVRKQFEDQLSTELGERQTVTKLVEGLGQEINSDYKYYETVSRKENLVIANDFFNENGLQASVNEIASNGGKLSNEQKQSLYFITRAKLDAAFDVADNEQKLEIADLRDQIDNAILPKITEAAQYLNNTQVLYDLNPELKAWSYENGIIKQSREVVNNPEMRDKIDALVKELNDLNKKHIDEVARLASENIALQEKLDKAKTTDQKAKEKITKAKTARKNAIDEWKKSLRNRASSSVIGLTQDDIKVIGAVTKTFIDEGVANFEILSNKVYDALKEALKKELSDEMTLKIRDIASSELAKKSEKDLSKNVSKDIIREIIVDHFTNPVEGKSLSDRFFELPNMDYARAKEIEELVSNNLRNITRESKKKLIAKHSKLPREKVKAAETHSERMANELMLLSNSGVITHDDVRKAISEKYKMTHSDKNVFENIKKLGLAAKKLPLGSLERRQAVSKQLQYFTAVTTEAGISRYYTAYYYANILTSIGIHIANNVTNSILIFGRYIANTAKIGIKNPNLIKDFNKVMNEYRKRAVTESKMSLRTGESGYLGHISEGNVSQQLLTKAEIELADKASKTLSDKILWAFVKYVNLPNQLLNGSDALFHELHRGITLFNDTVTEAKKEGYRGKELALEVRKRIDYATTKAAAELTATAEGFKKDGTKAEKDAYKRRVSEITESNIYSKQAKANSYLDGAINTLKGHPMGSISRPAARMLHGLHRQAPIVAALVNPFVNIVGNIYDMSVKYSPFGWFDIVRLKAFKSDAIKNRSNVNPNYNFQKDMADRVKNAIVGTLFGATILALTQMDDDDGEPLLEITGHGTGDYNLDKQKKLTEGYKPYSFRVKGGKWISYRAMTPLFITLALVGNYSDMQKYGKINSVLNDFAKRMYKKPYDELTKDEQQLVNNAATEKDSEGKPLYNFTQGDIVWDNLSRYAFSTLNVLAENAITNSILSTGTRFNDMIDNGGKGAGSLIGNIAASSVAPSIAREVASGVRNVEVESKTPLEYFTRALSVVPSKDQVAKDAFGIPVKLHEGGIMNTVGYMTLGKTVGFYNSDPVWKFLSEENIKYQKPDDYGMSEDQYDKFVGEHGKIMHEYINENRDRYKKMQHSEIVKDISAMKGAVTKALLVDYLPTIPKIDTDDDYKKDRIIPKSMEDALKKDNKAPKKSRRIKM